jgi:hypothetical protein
MTAPPRVAGLRLGTYVFKNAEIVDFAAPYGVFSVARRSDPEVGAFLAHFSNLNLGNETTTFHLSYQ